MIGQNIIISHNICEYDIRKANISVLFDAGMIDEKTYNTLYMADRMERQKYVGLLQLKDEKYTKVLQEGIEKARNVFLKRNGIDKSNIIRISNDAIYTHSIEAHHTKITPHVEFVKKSSFTSYMKVEFNSYIKGYSYEIFYGFDPILQKEWYKVLGIKDTVQFHDNFMQLILMIFNILETSGMRDGLKACMDVIRAYENREYPIEFYRPFDSRGKYLYNGYYVDDIDGFNSIGDDSVNFNHNLNILYAIKNNILRCII
mgnify:CR=1 FL=1|jgi:hypothetical protein